MPDIVLSSIVNNSGVQRGMAELRNYVREGASEIRGQFATAFAVGSVIEAGKAIFEFGAHVADLSERLGINSTALQQVTGVAEQYGSSLEGVAAGLNKLEIARSKALSGDEAMAQHFAALNVSLEDLRNLRPEEIINKVGASSLNAADVVAVFGRNGLELVPTFRAIADGSAPLGKAIDNIIKKFDEADDALKRFGQTGRVEGANFIAGFMDSMKGLKDFFSVSPFSKEAWDFTPGGAKKAPQAGDKDFIGPINQKSRIDSEEASAGAGGSAKGGADKSESLRERLAKITRESYLDTLSKQQRINALTNEWRDNQDKLVDGINRGSLGEQEQLEIRTRNVELTKQIGVTQKEITAEQKKATDEAIRAREAAAATAEKHQEELTVARENTQILRAEASGQHALAEVLKVKFDYEDKIRQARKDGNESLAQELQLQKEIALEELKRAKVREAQEQTRLLRDEIDFQRSIEGFSEGTARQKKIEHEYQLKINQALKDGNRELAQEYETQQKIIQQDENRRSWSEGMQKLADNLSGYSTAEILQTALNNTPENMPRNFGGPSGGPSMQDQLRMGFYTPRLNVSLPPGYNPGYAQTPASLRGAGNASREDIQELILTELQKQTVALKPQNKPDYGF